jgi:hypothetical protein
LQSVAIMTNERLLIPLALALAGAGCGAPDGAGIGGERVTSTASALTNDGDCTQSVSANAGTVLQSPRLVNIYWGAEWTSTGAANVTKLDDFSSKLITNPFFMTYLFQYSGINRGSFGGSTVVNTDPASSAGAMVDASQTTCGRLTSPVVNEIASLYGAGQIESPTSNTLYVIYLPSTVRSQFDVCNGFAGHHYFATDSNGNLLRYAVIENGSLDTMTSLASHEIVEAASDPNLNAWAAGNNEIGDICQNNSRTRIDGYQIEQYWSNRYCRCVRPEGVNEASGVSMLATDSGRIGVIENSQAYVKSNDLDGTWTLESSDVKQIVLDGVRIGVVKTNGDVYVKEGALDAGWVLESGDVTQLAMNDGRIGVLKSNGDAYVKEGALDAGWVLESSGVTQLVLAGQRIGVLQSNGQAWVKEGGLDAGWVLESSAARQLALSYSRIGVISSGRFNNGQAWVKDGALDAAWVRESFGVAQLVLDRDRIGIVGTTGAAYVKHGALDALWSRVSDSASKIVFAGNGAGYQWLSWPGGGWNIDSLPGTSTYVGILDTSGTAWTTDAGF